MTKQVITTQNAPQAIGPYSQAIKAGQFVFISGQIPIDPKSGEMVAGGIEEQTKQVMANLKAILVAAGLGFENVVKTTIFLTDLNHFAKVNEIYGQYFVSNPPARATVQVAALPKSAMIEIEATAYSQN